MITIEFNKSNKTNINEKAHILLNPKGYDVHQAFSAKLNSSDSIKFTYDFESYEALAKAINLPLEDLQEGLTYLYEKGYLMYHNDDLAHKDILKFYQNGTVSAKDDWSLVSSMMGDNYYIVREWIDREVF